MKREENSEIDSTRRKMYKIREENSEIVRGEKSRRPKREENSEMQEAPVGFPNPTYTGSIDGPIGHAAASTILRAYGKSQVFVRRRLPIYHNGHLGEVYELIGLGGMKIPLPD